MIDKQFRKNLYDYFFGRMDDRIEMLARLAWWDLWYGPLTFCEACGVDSLADCTCEHKWPGFSKAVDELRAWADKNITSLYYDADAGFFMESIDDEDNGGTIFTIEAKEVRRALFREVADYL